MSAGRFEYTIGFKTDNSGLKQAMDSLKSIQNITTKTPGFSGMSAEIAEAKKGAFDLEQALTRAFNPKMGSVNTVALRNELSKLNLAGIRTDLMKMGPIGETAFNQVATSAMKANLQIKQSNSLITKFGNTLFRNLEWLVSGRIISTVAGVFTKAYGFTKNLDSSLNDIRIVTGKSADEMARFGQEAQKTAMALGKGTTDVTNASLIFYQQGLEQEEVDKRTEITTKMANVTGQSTEIVADQMTAVWNGFQAGNDELERYADVMTKVAASTASSSAELAGAISKTASIAKVTGVDMEQLTSMISTVISVTRDSPETVGTAFKTIFARINDLVEDGTDEFGVSLGRVSSHLAAMGIEILNEDGTLKDLGVTLTEVGEKWSSYSKEQQVAIAEQMGGKRQWGQILALFDHWDDYKDTLLEATEATGSLDSQQEIYMDRVEAHLQQVKTAWEGVYAQIFNEKDIITIADAIKKVLEGVQTFLETVGGFKPVLDMVITMMLQAFGPKMAQEIDRTFSNIKGAFANLETQTAQKDITLMFGNLGDKGLLSELVEHQKTMNRYKDQMNEKDREQYSNYLKQKIELNEQTKILSEQVEKAKEFAQARSEIGQTYAQAGSFDSSAFGVASIEDRLNTIRNLTQGSTADLSMTYALDTQVEAFKTEKIARVAEIQDLIDKLKAYKVEVQNATNNESEINRINKLMEALEGVKNKFTNATTQTEQFKRELNNSTVAAEKAAAELQKVRGATPSTNRTDVLGQFAAGRDNSTSTKFREANTKVLADTQANVDTYKNLVKDLGNASIFSAEQVGKLNAQLSVQSPEIDKIKEALREELGVSEQGLENIMKVISQHSEGQLRVAEDTRKVLDSAQQSMEKSLFFRDQLTNLTRMASLASQMAMSFNQILNIGRIIQDEDIKGSEKIGQVLSSTAMMLPMFVSSLSNLSKTSFFSNLKNEINTNKQYEEIRKQVKVTAKEQQHAEKIVQEAHKKTAQAKEAVIQEQKKMIPIEQRYQVLSEKNEKITDKARTSAKKQHEENIKYRYEAVRGERLKQQAAINTAEANQTEALASETAAKKDLKEATASHAAAVANEEEAAAAGKAASAELAKKVAVAAAVAIIVVAIVAYKKIKEAQEELKETTQKNSEIIQEHIKANQELIKSNKKVLESFQDYDKVWDSFKQGKITVDEVRTSVEELAEALSLTENDEYLRLKRLAEYSGNYAEITNYLENQIRQNTIQSTLAGYRSSANLQEAIRRNNWIQDRNEIEKTFTNSYYYNTTTEGNWANERENIVKSFNEKFGKGIIKQVKNAQEGGYEYGFKINFSKISFDQLPQIVSFFQEQLGQNDNLDKVCSEILDELQNYTKQSDKEKSAEADAEIWKLFSGERTEPITVTVSAEPGIYIPGTDIKKPENALTSRYFFSGFDFDKDKTTERDIQQQLNNFAEFYQAYMAEQKKFITEEEAYQTGWNWFMQTQLGAKDALISIEYKNSIRDSINQIIKEVNKEREQDEQIQLIDENTLNGIEEKLKEKGLDLTQIDWAGVNANPTLLQDLTDGFIDEADIEKLTTYRKQINYLTNDYQALGSTLDNIIETIEKGNSSQSKILASKDFESILEAEQELEAVFGTDSKVADAYDIIAKAQAGQLSVYSESFKTALEDIKEAMADAEIEKSIQGFNKAFEDVAKVISSEATDIKHTIGELGDALTQITDADYTIEVAIRTKMEDAYDDIKGDFKDLTDAAGKIGENFEIDVSDLDTVADAFPGILKGMQTYSDGTVRLNKEVVESATQTAYAEVNAEKQALIDKLQTRKEELQHKINIYDKIINAADQAANTETKREENLGIVRQGLEDLRTLNSEKSTTKIEQTNQEAFKKSIDQYETLSKIDEKYWQQVQDNQEAALKGGKVYSFTDTADYQKWKDEVFNVYENPFQTGDDGTYTWDDVTDPENWKDPTKAGGLSVAIKKSLDEWKENRNKLQEEVDLTNDTIQRLQTISLGTENLLKHLGEAKDKNTKSTKEAAEKEAELRDVLKEEIDAYHDVNLLIAKHRQELEQLQKAQDRLTGQSLIDNLKQQKKRYQDLNAVLEEKLRLNNEDAAYYRSQLEDQGVTFDEEGYISNDNAIRAEKLAEYNDAIASYNDMSYEDQNANKDWLDDKKQEYEDFKKLIEKYEKLKNPGEEIDKTLEEIQENLLKEFELDIQIINTEYQIKLDKGEIKRAEIQLQKDLQKIQDSDILGNAVIDIKTLLTFDETEEGKQLKENFEKIKEQYEYYINNNMDPPKQIEEAYKEVLESWTKYVSERTQQIEDIVTKSFDRLSEKLDRQKTQFETIDKIFEHDINLVKLRYGENAYQQLEELYRARERVSKAQLENTKLQVEVLQNALREAQEKNLGQDVINDLEDKLAEAYEAQRAMLEEHLNFLKEQSNQAIDEVFNHLSEQMAGVSLKDMKDQWDWVNKDSDDYYDIINAGYELEKLRAQIRKAINETDDVSTQQALNDLMNNELANLQQKDKLSKYDLERANALFDVEQKRAAFREAQNNKSKMRLRRDSSGNYSYQFVSDEDKVTTAMQDLADAQNQLYNIDKEAYKNNLDKLYEYYVEYQEKLKEANNDEERAQITQNYLTKIVELQGEHLDIIDALQQTAAEKTGKRFEEMAQAEKDILMGDLIPAWSSAWATMIRDPNFEKFLAINGAEASDIAAEFELKSDAAIQDITGTTLEDIANGIDPAVEVIDSMVESTKNLSTELYDLLAILSTLPSAFDNNVESIDSLIATAKDRYNNLMAERVSTKDSINKAKMTDKSIKEIDLTVPKEPIEIDRTLDNTSILTKTLKIISDKIDKFYTDQMSLLKLESTKSSLNSVYNTNVNSSTPTLEAPIYIDANFPAVNSAQEIKDALNMLVNQATQKAFNTLR